MTAYTYLQTRREDDALVAVMSNPPRHTLNAAMVEELHALADEVAGDAGVRALILTGGAEGTFITHYDVGELAGVSDAARTRSDVGAGPELHGMHKLLLKLQALPQPVIAAINGTAMGGGCELALACDFRLMAAGDGVMGLPEVRVGILPGAGGTQRMTRLLGTARALEMMLLGETVDAVEAARIGLVHRAVESSRLMEQALALAAELAARPALSIALIKQCVLQGAELPLEDGLRFEQERFWRTMRSEDAGRLMRAYLQGNTRLDQQ